VARTQWNLARRQGIAGGNRGISNYQYGISICRQGCLLAVASASGRHPGQGYRTIVNIHNPSEKTVTIAAKVALSTAFGTDPGPFSVMPFKSATLQADGAVELSCFDIAGYFCPIDGVCVDFAFLEGFVVIKSAVPLDVVEAIQPRQIREMVKLTPPAAGPKGRTQT
jgi:hypothetical protein